MMTNNTGSTFSLIKITVFMLLVSVASFSQVKLKGKVFSTLYSTSSTKTKYGGRCMIYTYCSLEFDKTTVKVSFHSEADCNSEPIEKEFEKSSEKTYEWFMSKKAIYFKGFKEFEALSFSDGKLVGKKFSSDKATNIEFDEVP